MLYTSNKPWIIGLKYFFINGRLMFYFKFRVNSSPFNFSWWCEAYNSNLH
jgi:hypothetical protein